MASDHRGSAVVIMGVSGSGKSTVGEMLSKDLGCNFLEADDFHPKANKDKMSKGIPLSDDDRTPWLKALRDTTMERMSIGETVVLTCSALQKKYREVLRTADLGYEPGSYSTCRVKFVCLEAPASVIADRIERRSTEGKHFMPASLLQSQLDLLQIDEDEGIIRVDTTQDLGMIMDFIKANLNDKMSKGIPLSDDDRTPWLKALRDTTMERMSIGETVVLTCSALQKKYREVLRTADLGYEPGSYSTCRVKFVCLEAPASVIADRIERRSTEGKHFMPASLLQSQLDLLQIDEDEGIIRVDTTQDLGVIMDFIKANLNGNVNCI